MRRSWGGRREVPERGWSGSLLCHQPHPAAHKHSGIEDECDSSVPSATLQLSDSRPLLFLSCSSVRYEGTGLARATLASCISAPVPAPASISAREQLESALLASYLCSSLLLQAVQLTRACSRTRLPLPSIPCFSCSLRSRQPVERARRQGRCLMTLLRADEVQSSSGEIGEGAVAVA